MKALRKILVQVGHCSKSVGAEEIFQFFDEHANESDLVSIAGCDGACFNAPQMEIASLSDAPRCTS